MKHGPCGYSNQKCRCRTCRDGWAAYMISYRRRRKKAGGRRLLEVRELEGR